MPLAPWCNWNDAADIIVVREVTIALPSSKGIVKWNEIVDLKVFFKLLGDQ